MVPRDGDAETLTLRLSGARTAAPAAGLDPLPGVTHYLLGRKPSGWRRSVPTFAKARFRGVYPQVDVVYYGTAGRLEYDFLVRPGGSPGRIRIEAPGAIPEIRPDGSVLLTKGALRLRQEPPVAYQEHSGKRRRVACAYTLDGEGRLGFELGAYDSARTLVIDPVLTYATYLGGSGHDQGNAVAVDLDGNTYVTGTTNSTDFPVTPGAFRSSPGGLEDVFVTKLNPSGTAVVYTAYVGGAGGDVGQGIAVDPGGNVYVVGTTTSENFPTAPAGAALQGSRRGAQDAFVLKLSAAGSVLAYSTYLGGDAQEFGSGIAVNAQQSAYVTGATESADNPVTAANEGFPTTASAAQRASGRGGLDAFIARLSPEGTALGFSTYLGGDGADQGLAIALDPAANAYVTGSTTGGFPVTRPVQPGFGGGGQDAFAAMVSASGDSVQYATYLGGSGLDQGRGIAVDAGMNAYVAGVTFSPNFPTSSPFRGDMGEADAFLTKLGPGGSTTVYSTYLGGSGTDLANGVAVDIAGNAYVAGATASADFPAQNTLHPFRGETDAFVTRLSPSGGALDYSTFLGGSSYDEGLGVAVDGGGNAHVTGVTRSAGVATPNTVRTEPAGGFDAFVARLPLLQPAPAAPGPLNARAVSSSAAELSWTDNSTDELAFELERRKGSEPFTLLRSLPAGTTAFTDTGLEAGAQYTYRVRSTGAGGPSAFSNEASVQTLSVPPPSNLSGVAESATQVRLSWQDNTANETGFELQRKDGEGDFRTLQSLGPGVTSTVDATLSANTEYTYRVRALTPGGASDWSNAVLLRTAAIGAPSNLTANALSQTRVQLRWRDNSEQETGFELQRRTAAGTFVTLQNLPAGTTSFVDTGLAPNTEYHYRLRATGPGGASEFTSDTSVKTLAIPLRALRVRPRLLRYHSVLKSSAREKTKGVTVVNTSDQVVTVAPSLSNPHGQFELLDGDPKVLGPRERATFRVKFLANQIGRKFRGSLRLTGTAQEGRARQVVDVLLKGRTEGEREAVPAAP